MSNLGSRLSHRLLGAAPLIGAMASSASAQWAVINLHPTEAADVFDSYAYGVQDGQQVGYVRVVNTFLPHASV